MQKQNDETEMTNTLADGMGVGSGSSRLRAWMELLRAPNLFTVPGDPIAGFLLANAGWLGVLTLWRVLPVALASLFLYMAGLITNDLWDLGEDRRERPGRPIASGRIRPQTAITVAAVLFVLGTASAALAGFAPAVVAWTLMVVILAYNAGAKRVAVLGPLTMGLCRGLSLLMGAAAFGPDALLTPLVLVAAGGLTLYVASVTLIAAKETSGKAPGKRAWFPCWIVPLWLTVLGGVAPWSNSLTHFVAVVIALAAAIWVWRWSMATQRATRPEAVSLGVGRFLQGLLLLQASMAAMAMSIGIWVSLGLVLLVPVSVLVGRRFYAS